MILSEMEKTNLDVCKEIMSSNLSEEAKVRAIQAMGNEDIKVVPKNDGDELLMESCF